MQIIHGVEGRCGFTALFKIDYFIHLGFIPKRDLFIWSNGIGAELFIRLRSLAERGEIYHI